MTEKYNYNNVPVHTKTYKYWVGEQEVSLTSWGDGAFLALVGHPWLATLSLCNHLRDVPWEDIFKLSASLCLFILLELI